MGTIITTPCSHILLDQAVIVPQDRDVASHWASQHMVDNPAYRWIVGKYVEADAPNSNMQQWRLGDLEVARETVKYAPLNVLHRPEHIVGNFVGTEMLYPTRNPQDEAAQVQPFIEAVAAYWHYYFPTEFAIVERSFNEGSLYFSMESVAESIEFISPEGESAEFPYVGPQSESYGAWGKDPQNIKQLNRPHFLAGALIFPPTRPGWKGAHIKDLAALIQAHESEAEAVYETFKQGSPHLSPEVWEELMLDVMNRAKS
jgi:hypothetical protein